MGNLPTRRGPHHDLLKRALGQLEIQPSLMAAAAGLLAATGERIAAGGNQQEALADLHTELRALHRKAAR